MSDASSPHQVEFIRLNNVTVRVTSWRAGVAGGSFDLVTITRGSRDAETLDDIFRQSRVALDIGDQGVREMKVAAIDRRTVGEGQAGITRYAVTLVENDAGIESEDVPATSALTLDERVTALESDIQALKAMIESHVNEDRH